MTPHKHDHPVIVPDPSAFDIKRMMSATVPNWSDALLDWMELARLFTDPIRQLPF